MTESIMPTDKNTDLTGQINALVQHAACTRYNAKTANQYAQAALALAQAQEIMEMTEHHRIHGR